jgi:hypothetical protein
MWVTIANVALGARKIAGLSTADRQSSFGVVTPMYPPGGLGVPSSNLGAPTI